MHYLVIGASTQNRTENYALQERCYSRLTMEASLIKPLYEERAGRGQAHRPTLPALLLPFLCQFRGYCRMVLLPILLQYLGLTMLQIFHQSYL